MIKFSIVFSVVAITIGWLAYFAMREPTERNLVPGLPDNTTATTYDLSNTLDHERVSLADSPHGHSQTILIRIVSAIQGAPVGGAQLLGLTRDKPNSELALMGESDINGYLHILRDPDIYDEVVIYHNLYVVKLVNYATILSRAAMDLVVEPRPNITCLVEGVKPQDATAYEFHVSLVYDNNNLQDNIMAMLKLESPSVRMPGFAPVSLRPPQYGSCEVKLIATLKDHSNIFQSCTCKFDDLKLHNAAVLRFIPELQADRVDVTLDVEFGFPEDAAVDIMIRGPFVSANGPVIRSGLWPYDIETRSNVPGKYFLRGMVPGIYGWTASVLGRGSFDMGTFIVSSIKNTVRLRNDLNLVAGRIGIELDKTLIGTVIDLRILGELGATISGNVFRPKDLRRSLLIYDYVVPRGIKAWAVATIGRSDIVSRPFTLSTIKDGSYCVINRWTRRHMLYFSTANNTDQRFIHWIEIESIDSGIAIRSEAHAGPKFKPVWLVEGLYSARAVWIGGTSQSVQFRVPHAGDNIEIELW